MAAEKEADPSIPVPEIVSLEVGISSQEDTGTPTVEPTILITDKSVNLIFEDSLSRESVASKLRLMSQLPVLK